MKINDTDKCTFCNEEEETIEHLLTTYKFIHITFLERSH